MRIAMSLFNKAVEESLPQPGSINFDNAQLKIEIPIFQTLGWIELAVEGDPSGMKSGGHEVIRQQAGKLVFHKKGKEWELEILCEEEVVEIARMVRDRMETEFKKKQTTAPEPKTRTKRKKS